MQYSTRTGDCDTPNHVLHHYWETAQPTLYPSTAAALRATFHVLAAMADRLGRSGIADGIVQTVARGAPPDIDMLIGEIASCQHICTVSLAHIYGRTREGLKFSAFAGGGWRRLAAADGLSSSLLFQARTTSQDSSCARCSRHSSSLHLVPLSSILSAEPHWRSLWGRWTLAHGWSRCRTSPPPSVWLSCPATDWVQRH